ncbi:ABC transporter permease [Brucella pseudogrignonensis]|uniref:Peptide/nickel transport system permease protein n=1 Tax=Brucella pseudogrignonensis TaxID=419475 RepID=A0ABU1M736_9HYPH|nr:ABC transporter permease [Brucella pseudogrignonensis]MDR6431850.1 peptide/nickel transport system permease protein [Brucella pseudogrignonensis]
MKAFPLNGRIRALISAMFALAIIAAISIGAWAYGNIGVRSDFSIRNLPPSFAHWFGTDQMGRDMLARTLHGLTLSLRVGILAAGFSVIIALIIVLLSGLGKAADAIGGFITDAMLAMPHLVLLILISFALGGGTGAVIIAVAISHWPRFARILRAELIQVRVAPFVEASRSFGKSRSFILINHILPHLLPQMLVGFLLMFPHAILHEAGLTFLGFGLEPSRPAVGIMLSEAMQHITGGRWWLAVFPGLALLIMVLCFDLLANALRRLISPKEAHI